MQETILKYRSIHIAAVKTIAIAIAFIVVPFTANAQIPISLGQDVTDNFFQFSFTNSSGSIWVPFTNLDGSLIDFELAYSRNNAGFVEFDFTWYECGTSNPVGDGLIVSELVADCSSIASESNFDEGDIDMSNTSGVINYHTSTLTVPNTIIFDPDKWYMLRLEDSSVSGFTQVRGGALSNNYTDQAYYQYTSNTSSATGISIYFSMNLTSSGGFVTRISNINNPIFGEITASTTVTFDFDYYIGSNDQGVDKVGFEIIDPQGNRYGVLESSISSSGLINYSQDLELESGSSYFWRPYLRDNATDFKQAEFIGDYHQFFVVTSDGYESVFIQPDASTTSDILIDCDFNNVLSNGICNVVGWLFVPSQSSLNNFVTLQQNLSSKFPFAYFYEIKDVIENISTGSADFPSLTLSIPTSTALSLSFEYFSEDTVTEFAGDANVALFRTLMEAGLWLSFASMVFFTVRNMFRKE